MGRIGEPGTEGPQHRELFLSGGGSIQTAGRLIVSEIRDWILRRYGSGGRAYRGCEHLFLRKLRAARPGRYRSAFRFFGGPGIHAEERMYMNEKEARIFRFIIS